MLTMSSDIRVANGAAKTAIRTKMGKIREYMVFYSVPARRMRGNFRWHDPCSSTCVAAIIELRYSNHRR
jgi:hypothetical protein